MKKSIFIVFLTIALVCPNLMAEQSQTLSEKLQALRDTIKGYWQGAPKLSMAQKFRIGRLLRSEKQGLQEDFQKLRSIIMDTRKQFRKELTRDQLLTLLDAQDEFAMRAPGKKAALLLSKLEKQDRVQLISLMRAVWRCQDSEIEQNLQNLKLFVRSNIHPYVHRRLSLNDQQIAAWNNLATQNEAEVQSLVVKIVKKLHEIRGKVREILSAEQIAFIEANRDKIFQEVMQFIDEL